MAGFRIEGRVKAIADKTSSEETDAEGVVDFLPREERRDLVVGVSSCVPIVGSDLLPAVTVGLARQSLSAAAQAAGRIDTPGGFVLRQVRVIGRFAPRESDGGIERQPLAGKGGKRCDDESEPLGLIPATPEIETETAPEEIVVP